MKCECPCCAADREDMAWSCASQDYVDAVVKSSGLGLPKGCVVIEAAG